MLLAKQKKAQNDVETKLNLESSNGMRQQK